MTLEKALFFAEENSDGHFTIMRFTTNWRAGFFTPQSDNDIQCMSEGLTMNEAIQAAIEDHYVVSDYRDSAAELGVRDFKRRHKINRDKQAANPQV